MTVDPAAWKPAEPALDRYPRMEYAEQAGRDSVLALQPALHDLSEVLASLVSVSDESGTLYGALTFGQDAVQRHLYTANVLYGPKNGRVWYDIDYFYDGLYPTLHVHASDNDVTYGSFPAGQQGREGLCRARQDIWHVVIVPHLKFASQHAVTIGYQRKELAHLTDLPPWPAIPAPCLPRECSRRAAWSIPITAAGGMPTLSARNREGPGAGSAKVQ